MDRKTIGRYEIIDELGRGAMGSVLRARDPAVGRTVALKCILSTALAGDQKSEFRDRFFREARAAGALAHPGIVPVFDVGEDDGVPYLVMELVQGRTLDNAMKAGERYSLERVCEIGQQIAEALGYAHRNGVVHRDVKPANILMTSREVYGSERPRITDFGVAKLAGGEITTTGQLLGTPAFMAPEQFTGAPVDGRSDLFSLGVILYRMATGEQPFGGETITAVSYKIVHTDPIPASRLNPAVGPKLEAVILRTLAKNPSERFQTGEELAAELAAARPGAQAAGIYPPPQPFHAGQDPGATMDMISGTLPRTFPGQPPAPQWSTMAPGIQTLGPDLQTAGPGMPPQPQMPRPQQPPPAPQWPVNPGAQRPAGQGMPPVVPAPYPVPPLAAPPQRPMASAPPLVAPAAAPTPQPPRNFEPLPQPPRTSAPVAQPVAVPRPAPAESPAMSTLSSRRSTVKIPDEMEEKSKKKGIPVLFWIIAAAIVLLATWYFRGLRVNPNTGEIADSSPSIASTASTPGASASSPAPAGAATVNFNPRNLDPGRSGRLRLGLDSFPTAVLVGLQMDGSPYWSGAAGLSTDNLLFVPPGRHEFRIIVYGGGGTSPISSNSAGADISLKRGLLLTAQVRPQPSAGAATLAPGTRVSLTIRPDPSSM